MAGSGVYGLAIGVVGEAEVERKELATMDIQLDGPGLDARIRGECGDVDEEPLGRRRVGICTKTAARCARIRPIFSVKAVDFVEQGPAHVWGPVCRG